MKSQLYFPLAAGLAAGLGSGADPKTPAFKYKSDAMCVELSATPGR